MRRWFALAVVACVSLVGCVETDIVDDFAVAEGEARQADACRGHSQLADGAYYVGDTNECMLIHFFCAEGMEYFSDACGCGCTPVEENPCMISGCSGQYCVGPNDEPSFSTCEWQPEYACYDTAACEPQNNGQCGWTNTRELRECLRNPPSTLLLQ